MRIAAGALLALLLVPAVSFATSKSDAAASPNIGTVTTTSIKPDGTRVTETKTIDMDAYISSGGAVFDVVQRPATSECDPDPLPAGPPLPTVPVFPPSPPPPSPGYDPSVGHASFDQGPFPGSGGAWHQTTDYYRQTNRRPDGTFGPPGPWSNPVVVQHGPPPGGNPVSNCNENPT
jgi:hypothetical protein